MKSLSQDELRQASERTLGDYQATAESFERGTRDHDVSQNIEALLDAIARPAPLAILDFGCGPGRDLARFKALGHQPVGLDGCAAFARRAHEVTGCEVLHQNFLELDLPPARFDGIFANASLFHVPRQELQRVLGQLRGALVENGVVFSSNPRGDDEEGFSGKRYGAFHSLETWRAELEAAAFSELSHYYRPPGKPRDQQPWLASVWRKR